jgi:uncharacterized protein
MIGDYHVFLRQRAWTWHGHLQTEKMREFLGRYLGLLCRGCYQKPLRTLSMLGLSFVLAVAYGSQNLRLELAWTYLFESDDPIVREFEYSRDTFPYPGDIAILVDQGSVAQRERFLDLVAKEMGKEPDVYHHVFHRLDLTTIGNRALFFLNEDLLSTLAQAMLNSDTISRDRLVSEPAVKLQLKLLGDLKDALVSRGRSTTVPVWRAFADDQEGQVAESLSKLLNGERYVYTTIAQSKVHVLLFKGGTRGSELTSDGKEVQRARELLERVQPAAYGLRVRLTGLPVMLFDERQTCAEDSLRAGVLSLALILGVFVVGFGGFRKPLFSLAGLVCGLGWTLAYSAMTIGHLNFITVTMVSMLMGLGIDFGIHFLFRYEEQRRKGVECPEAIEATARTTGVDTLIGATATSASFLALTATDFRGVSDLGVLASGGVILCFFSTVMMLPALLKLFPSEPTPRQLLLDGLARFESQLLEHSRIITFLAFLAVGLGLLLASRVGFTYNLLDIQAQDLASVQTEREMLADYNTTVLSGAVIVDGPERARKLAAKLKELKTVSQVGTLTDLLPEVTYKKRILVGQVVASASRLEIPTPIALERARDLLSLQQKLREIERKSMNVAQNPDVATAVNEVKEVVADLRPGPLQDGLQSFQRAILRDFTKLIRLLKAQEAVPVEIGDLPESLRVRYVSPEGKYLLSVQPSDDIWQRENLQRFLTEVESLDVTLVGYPVVQAHILQSFDRAFRVTPWYTLLGVFSVMLVYLRRPGQVLLSSLPTALGVVFIFAVMGFAGIEFNVVNFVALPISVGIGAVYGVHAIHRMEEMGEESLLSSSTGYAILLSGLTTIAGFASLMTANHQGLSSFGFVISVGVVANLVVSLVVLPAVRRCFQERS